VPDVLMPGPADATVRVWTAGADGRRIESGHAGGAAPAEVWPAFVHPADVERCQEIYRSAIEKREPFQLEYRVRDADGVERWTLDTGLPRFSGETFTGYVGSAIDMTRLGGARAELSNLSRYLMQAHEQESAALARKLHEDVCQRMVALTLRLHTLERAENAGELAEIRAQLASLVSEIATVSRTVHQRLELLGLASASRDFCRDLSTRHHVAIHYEDEDVPRDLPAEIALALFRVLQEATVNAVLHSSAREVWVSMRGTTAEVRLQVLDLGVGFDPQRAATSGGVGLVAIRERLKLVHGESVIVSRPGAGTRVEAWVPLRRTTEHR
jgi:signal transduction histidine kinase